MLGRSSEMGFGIDGRACRFAVRLLKASYSLAHQFTQPDFDPPLPLCTSSSGGM